MRFVQRDPEADQRRVEHEVAFVINRYRQFRFDQRLVEPPCRLGRHQCHQHLDRRRIGVGSGGDTVGREQDLAVANPAHGHFALAVLGGLDCPQFGQFPSRAGHLAEVVSNPGQRLGAVNLARHQQHGVVRLIVSAVEGAQIIDTDVFDIAAVADGGIAVVVPHERRGKNLLVQRPLWPVFTHLELVADHRHFGVELFAQDVGVDHAIGLHLQRPLQVVVTGGKALVVVGAIKPGGAVVDETTIGHVLPEFRVFRR